MSGSFSFIHNNLGAVNPGITRLPVITRAFVTVLSSVRHWSSLRPSFHNIAGRNTRPALSSRVAPCICPARPSALTTDKSLRCFNSSSVAQVAVHQSSGFCSDHSGCGMATVNEEDAESTTLPLSSVKMVLTPDVPRSIPIYIVTLTGKIRRLC